MDFVSAFYWHFKTPCLALRTETSCSIQVLLLVYSAFKRRINVRYAAGTIFAGTAGDSFWTATRRHPGHSGKICLQPKAGVRPTAGECLHQAKSVCSRKWAGALGQKNGARYLEYLANGCASIAQISRTQGSPTTWLGFGELSCVRTSLHWRDDACKRLARIWRGSRSDRFVRLPDVRMVVHEGLSLGTSR